MDRLTFAQAVMQLRGTAYPDMPDRVSVAIPNAEAVLRCGLRFFIGPGAQWHEQAYRPVVEWMHDNHGLGLLLAGACGLGKTIIGMRVLPVAIHAALGKIVSCYRAQELNTRPDEILAKHLVYIDDVGTESMANIYGNKRLPFMELCDLAEQQGKLLILSTNLDPQHLADKYGTRTVDRLRAITRYVPFNGQSMRGKQTHI